MAYCSGFGASRRTRIKTWKLGLPVEVFHVSLGSASAWKSDVFTCCGHSSATCPALPPSPRCSNVDCN